MPDATDEPAARPRSVATAEAEPHPPGATLRIRMYNVGFGDAFLLFIPTDDGERTMLVDCGAHMSGSAGPISAIVQDILDSVTAGGRARIDVVVATHRHYDHISGFALKIWQDVEVGEVWMPWTEQRGNAGADAIRRAQHRLALALSTDHPTGPIARLALNSLSNRDSEETLRRGFAGDPVRRYLPAVDRPDRTFTTTVLPGITVHALGPSHDPDVVALLDPPAGKGYPFRARDPEADDDDEAAPASPREPALFNARFVTPAAEVEATDHARWARADTAALQEATAFDSFAAASSLENAVNGTSLVLVLEIGREHVLLAGDAEWGTWSEVLEDKGWRALLRRTSVYKVSHHGSWNGTPKPFVDELLADDAVSLMSFKPVKSWPSIPRPSLIDALAAGDRTLVRSDLAEPADGRITRSGLWTELEVAIGP